jgi:hypothetical protein
MLSILIDQDKQHITVDCGVSVVHRRVLRALRFLALIL